MPATWNGIGTTFIGVRDRNPDGSFLTTEWFVILSFPIFPIRSVRVLFVNSSSGWQRSTTKYMVGEKVSLDIKQIILTYFFSISAVLVGIGSFLLVLVIFESVTWVSYASIICLFAPYLLVQWLFFTAK